MINGMSSYLATRFHDQLSHPAPRSAAAPVAEPQDGYQASAAPAVQAPPSPIQAAPVQAAPAPTILAAPTALAPATPEPAAFPDFGAGGLFSATQAAGGGFSAEPAWSAPAPPVTHYQSPVSLYIPLSSFHEDQATPATPSPTTKLTPLQQMGYYSGKDIQHSGAMAAMGYGSSTPQAKPTGIAALGYNLAK